MVKRAKIDSTAVEFGAIYHTALPSETIVMRMLTVEATMLARLESTAVPIPGIISRVIELDSDLPPHILLKCIDGTVLSELGLSLSMAQGNE